MIVKRINIIINSCWNRVFLWVSWTRVIFVFNIKNHCYYVIIRCWCICLCFWSMDRKWMFYQLVLQYFQRFRPIVIHPPGMVFPWPIECSRRIECIWATSTGLSLSHLPPSDRQYRRWSWLDRLNRRGGAVLTSIMYFLWCVLCRQFCLHCMPSKKCMRTTMRFVCPSPTPIPWIWRHWLFTLFRSCCLIIFLQICFYPLFSTNWVQLYVIL